MKKISWVIILIAIAGLAGWYYFFSPKGSQVLPGTGNDTGRQPALSGFNISRPELVAQGSRLAKVEIWAVPSGTEITESQYELMGNAILAASTSAGQAWQLPIPENPMSAAAIFARGFDIAGNKIGDKYLTISGPVDIYNALWGPSPEEDSITIWDNTRTFSYGVTSGFTIKLDANRYPQTDTKVTPAGIIGSVSNVPSVSAPYYALRFEGVKPGVATVKNGDFSVTIKVYDPEASKTEINNSRFNFSLSYPPYDIINPEFAYQYLTENTQVRLDLPQNDFMDTNLGEASFLVGASSAKAIVDKCLTKNQGEQSQEADATINRTTFKVFSGVDAAAGNLYQTKSYRTVKDGTCYEATELLHWGNIFNYSTGTVMEFDRGKANSGLDEILNTLNI